MEDQLAAAKTKLLDALRRAERDDAPKRTIRKLEKIIADIETLQASLK